SALGGGRVAGGVARCSPSGREFFVSSRRRHTRLVSDWSSDVCSSDLITLAAEQTGVHFVTFRPGGPKNQQYYTEMPLQITVNGRSEERRVGKGWRSRRGLC